MSELNINVEGGSSTKLLTAGKYCPDDIIITASGGGGGEVEPIVLTGDYSYGCAGDLAGNYINMYGNTITTKDITTSGNMFYQNHTVKKIPFDININNRSYSDMSNMFMACYELTEPPKINNAYPSSIGGFFSNCHNMRNIPDEFGDNWNFDRLHTYNYATFSSIFQNCYSLRKIPENFLKNIWSLNNSKYSTYHNMFNNCFVLDEIKGIGVIPVELTSSMFDALMFANCYRVKDITFATNEDGTPIIAKWKSQTIDLSSSSYPVGYLGLLGSVSNLTTKYNSGITADKKVNNDTSYQALKNNPDWFSETITYSRYNHDSAVNTINSLPDTSAYLAEKGGTNTIKFYGVSGLSTDGGAINTLTEAEIAVAAAKGWTVTLV